MTKSFSQIALVASMFIVAVAVAILPELAFAQTIGDVGGTVFGLIKLGIRILSVLIFLVFIWGLIKLLTAKSDDDKAQGKTYMIWSIIIFFVFVSIGGITQLLSRTVFGTATTGQITQEQVPGVGL